jgi:hypothetical protein
MPFRPRSWIKRLLAKPELPRKVVFTHVPKCAGTSLRRVIEAKFQVDHPADLSAFVRACRHLRLSGKLYEHADFLAVLQLYHMEMGCPFIADHFPVTKELVRIYKERGYLLTTILRDPLERFRSGYLYHRLRLDQMGLAPLATFRFEEEKEVFEDFIEERSRSSVIRTFEYYFGNAGPEVAIEILQSYDLVGFTEDVEPFNHALSKLLGVPLEVQRVNVSKRDFDDEKFGFLKTFLDDERLGLAGLPFLQSEYQIFRALRSA